MNETSYFVDQVKDLSSQFQDMEEFIYELIDLIESNILNEQDWKCVSGIQNLPEWFIERYKDELDWGEISFAQKLSEEFINRHVDRIDWRKLKPGFDYSEDFLWFYRKLIDFSWICAHCILTEEFVKKFAAFLNWNLIAQVQRHLPRHFIDKHNPDLPKMFWPKHKTLENAFVPTYNTHKTNNLKSIIEKEYNFENSKNFISKIDEKEYNFFNK